MILLNIDVTKIPKESIASKPEWKGKFLKLKLVEFPKDGNDGFIAVDQTKEQRQRKDKSVIVGNWKYQGNGGGQSGGYSTQDGQPRVPKPNQQSQLSYEPDGPDADF